MYWLALAIEVVSKTAQLTLNALTWSDLKLPLSGHDFSVDARNLDTSVQASFVVGLDDVSTVDLGGTNTAIIRTLRGWKASARPAVWPAVGT